MLKFGSAKGFGGLAPIATEHAAPVPAYQLKHIGWEDLVRVVITMYNSSGVSSRQAL